jgi:hypothetical protein
MMKSQMIHPTHHLRKILNWIKKPAKANAIKALSPEFVAAFSRVLLKVV